MAPNTSLASAQQRLGQIASQSTGGGGGGRNPDLFKNFRPRKDGTTCIRIVPGEYPNHTDGGVDPCFTVLEHRVWKGNYLLTIPCSEAPQYKDLNIPCVPCYYQRRGDNSISRSERRVFTTLVLEKCHKVEKSSSQNPDKKYTVIRVCDGRGCELCQQDLPSQFGDYRWWSLGKNHFDDIVDANRKLGKACTNCEKGKIERIGFECAKCGQELLMVEGSRLTDAKIDVFSQTIQTCRHCREDGLPKEIIECTGCQNPERANIYKANLWVGTRGEKTSSRVVVDEWEVAGIPREYQDKREPQDFQKLFTPPSPALAAKMLGMPDPFGDAAAGGNGAGRGRTAAYPAEGGSAVSDSPAQAQAGEVEYGN